MSSATLPLTVSADVTAPPSTRFYLGYRPWLDGLRGVAILAVMAYHFSSSLLARGYVGVDLFFVLSGFLITSLLLEEVDSTGNVSFTKFYVRRALRLFPALWLMLIASIALMYYALHSAEGYQSALYALSYVTNWAVAFGIKVPSPIVLTWSLSIEEQFYIVWPITLSLLLRFKVPKAGIIAILVLATLLVCLNRSHLLSVGENLSRVAHASDTRIDGLLIGCLVALWLAAGFPVPRSAVKAITALLGVFFLIYMNGAVSGYGYGLTLVNLFFGLSIMLTVSSGISSWPVRIFEHRWIVWTGKLSYGLYLWHIFALHFAARMTLPPLLFYITYMLMAFAFAAICYYAIERPFLNLKKRFVSSS